MRAEIRKRKNCFIKICFIVSVFAAIFPGVIAIGQQSPAVETFIIEGNRKAVHYQDGRLVFYDGIDNNAKPIEDVNCFEQRVISSKQGKYFATCVRAIDRTGPARIYNENGKKIGEFDLEMRWKILAISDWGDFLVLGQIFEGSSPTPIRISDFHGNILIDRLENCEAYHFKIALDGTPVVWGVTGGPFVSTLDIKGQFIDRHEFPYNEGWFIEDVLLSEDASILVLIKYSREKHYPDGIVIWDIKSNLFKTVIIPEDLGVIQQFNTISPKGSYTVLKLGGEAISLIDNKKGTEILHKKIAETFAGSFKQITNAAISDKGNVIVMGHSQGVVSYCVLDKTGKMTTSKVLDDFRNDGNTVGRFRIQELSKDRYAIVHKKNKIEIIDLK